MSETSTQAIAKLAHAVASYASILANPVRAAILLRLQEGPCIVGELARCAGAEQPVVSKQIGLLRSGGLIHCHPEGRCREYSLSDPEGIGLLLRLLSDAGRSVSRRSIPAPFSRGKTFTMEES